MTDKTDGKLAHLDGLNLSRAWMLDGIASGLPATDPPRGCYVAALWPAHGSFAKVGRKRASVRIRNTPGLVSVQTR